VQQSGHAALLARAREGSSEALGELLSRCGERLLALIRLRLGPRCARSSNPRTSSRRLS